MYVAAVLSRAAHLRDALAPPLPSCNEKVAASWNASRSRRGAWNGSSSNIDHGSCHVLQAFFPPQIGSSVWALVFRMRHCSCMARELLCDAKMMLLTRVAFADECSSLVCIALHCTALFVQLKQPNTLFVPFRSATLCSRLIKQDVECLLARGLA